MKYRVAAGVTVVALAAVAVYAILGFISGSDQPAARGPADASTHSQVIAPPSPANEGHASAIEAEPAPDGQPSALVLTAPARVEPGSSATFGARWVTQAGALVSGDVDLQRIQGNAWTTITTVHLEGGVGEVDAPVKTSGIYRLAYGGSEKVEAAASPVLVVTAGKPLTSRITATAEKNDDGVSVTAAWTTEGGVPIVGGLSLEQATHGEDGDKWRSVSSAVTGIEGTAVATVSAEHTTTFRFSYRGGARFAAAVSTGAVALGDDARNIPVRSCQDLPDIDVLPRGVGCHFTPVTSGTFVVAHDYLDNAWWNSIPIGTYIELTGELPGLYEVVDRVIAPGRGSALGSASHWTCGNECDVILQTCQGSNTGFTWLRRVVAPTPTPTIAPAA
jgi:hypothetical protein